MLQKIRDISNFIGDWTQEEKDKINLYLGKIYAVMFEVFPGTTISHTWIFTKIGEEFKARKNTWNKDLIKSKTIDEMLEKVKKKLDWIRRAKIYTPEETKDFRKIS